MSSTSNTTASAQEPSHLSQDQKVTPWDVEGEVVDGVAKAINYEKLMKQFGCQPLTDGMIERLERLTGRKAHVLIRRGMFYCHRYSEQYKLFCDYCII
jgi:tryptophanyl-tRNA synthetase